MYFLCAFSPVSITYHLDTLLAISPCYAYSYILPVFVILSAILLPHLATPYDVDIFVEN